ncbi:hypothetical protein Q4I32_008436 [Leishmania shawi]|uniref:Calphotin-like protein n=1 Tax=Leishmania shawi TaxID=5680 RepID=A0AAW3B7Z5_9TRYP
MSSVLNPVAPASPATSRKVTFVLPGEAKEVTAASPPAVPILVPSMPAVLPPTLAPLAAPSVPALPSLDFPQLHATEEELPKTMMSVNYASSEEKPVSPEEVPDYSKWVYPVLMEGSSACSPPLKFPLTDVIAPHVLTPAALLRWSEREVLATLPTMLPPDYIIFGGAKYSSTSLDLVHPPLAVATSAKRTLDFHNAMEAQRLQFLVDQLEVARHYLKIEARRVAKAQRTASTLTTAGYTAVPIDTVSDAIQKSGETEDVAMTNIWSAAYFGSPQQLTAMMEKCKLDGVLDSVGYVHYRRRLWGLKRVGDRFELGLGLRGTLLQFAAAAGKLDNVVILLTSGARDTATPRLKEILSAESMQIVEAILIPRTHAPRHNRAPTVGVMATSKATPPVMERTFISEHVVKIDEEGLSPLGRASDIAAAAMAAFA